MKRKKLIIGTLCSIGLLSGLFFATNNNITNTVHQARAKDPNSSEVVETDTEESKDLDELIQEALDKKFAEYEWYQENKPLIMALVTFICGALGTTLSFVILTHTNKKTITSMNNATGNINTLAKNQIEVIEMRKENLELKNIVNELKKEREEDRKLLLAMKDSIAVAYLNDPHMQDGRARKIDEILNGTKYEEV